MEATALMVDVALDPLRLDISDTYNMVRHTTEGKMCLRIDVLEWCYTVLGMLPQIDYHKVAEWDYDWVHVVFNHPADLILFKIHFAHKWEPQLVR